MLVVLKDGLGELYEDARLVLMDRGVFGRLGWERGGVARGADTGVTSISGSCVRWFRARCLVSDNGGGMMGKGNSLRASTMCRPCIVGVVRGVMGCDGCVLGLCAGLGGVV